MSFMGHPCPCGWALDDLNEEETLRGCARCGIRYEKKDGYWIVLELKEIKIDPKFDEEMSKRVHYNDPTLGGIKHE